MYDLIIVGSGPCGVMAAIQASNNQKKVLVIEQNSQILEKFSISGNNRCNLTNNKPVKDFLRQLDHPKALYKVINNFSPYDAITYFESLGIPLKEEDNNRIFPASNKASDLVKTLNKQLDKVDILLNNKVINVVNENNTFYVETNDNQYKSNNLLLATGGQTPSYLKVNKDSYNLALALGHSLTKLTTQECPIKLKVPLTKLMGITLENINLIIKDNDKVIDSEKGSLLFTHFGLSGPVVLNSSFAINKAISNNINLVIQFLGDYEEVKKIIYDQINNNPKKHLYQYLNTLLPKKLISFLLEDYYDIKNSELAKNQIKDIINKLSNFTCEFKSFYQPENAFLTGGGINLKEINLDTLESKIIPNLYLGGEMIDICGKLGGYNIHTALACGYTIGIQIT